MALNQDIASRQDAAAPEITLGPVLFNWPAHVWRDFYFRIADEAPVGTVYVGEVICAKRAPLFTDHIATVIDRLQSAGKRVVLSSLSETVLKLDRKLVESVCADTPAAVEANDASALYYLRGRPHRIGPLVNVYSAQSLAALAARGAAHVCLPGELPAASIAEICKTAKELGVTVEVGVFGRQQLALSARCYHARAHGRTKDTCQFICERDPDGFVLSTLDGSRFLAVNGVQTMSSDYLSLMNEMPQMMDMGVRAFRLSPHSCDMVRVAGTFDDVVHGRIAPRDGQAILEELGLDAPFANGFFHRRPGHRWITPAP